MANGKKYVEVFNDGNEDFYVCDQEARAAIEDIDPASNTATVDTCIDIINELV